MPPVDPTQSRPQANFAPHQQMADRMIELHQKILTSSYDKAASYTTVVIFGGYAGTFALWQLTKDHLSNQQALWAALLMLVSLTAFVLFEVGKMIFITKSIVQKAKVLQSPEVQSNPNRVMAALEELDLAQQGATKPYIISWAVSVFVALATALGGVGVLAFSFVHGLLR